MYPQNYWHNNHNVYILGAGFSVDAGLPIIKNFIKSMRCAVSDDAKRQAIGDILVWRLLTASAAYRCKVDLNNIEELFSLIDGAQLRDDVPKKEIMQKAIIDTLSFCALHNPDANRKTLLSLEPGLKTILSEAYLTNKKSSCSGGLWALPIYDAIASVLSGSFCLDHAGSDAQPQKNTIITFNYDTVIEDAFERIGAKFNLGLVGSQNVRIGVESDYRFYSNERDDNATSIFKVHGSINWKLKKGLIPSREPLPLVIKKDIDTLWSQSYPENYVYVLEPPTWNKGPYADILQPLWNASLFAIRTATRIFIIGYSLPETDVHFKYLMANGLAQNISLESICFVNPAVNDQTELDALSKRVFRIFREELKTEGIIEFLPDSSTSFILAEDAQRNSQSLLFRLYPGLTRSLFVKIKDNLH